jgi:hypothetical protein
LSKLILNGATSGSITLESPSVSGVNTLTLPANTGTVLTTASTFGGTGPAFSVYKSAGQSLSSATFTKITFNTEEFDTANSFASDRFTPNVAGYYQINGQVSHGDPSQPQTLASIYKNGSAYKFGTNSNAFSSLVSALVYLNGSTDYVELYGYTGTATTTSSVINNTWFNGAMVRGE